MFIKTFGNAHFSISKHVNSALAKLWKPMSKFSRASITPFLIYATPNTIVKIAVKMVEILGIGFQCF